ncbi:MAG: ATP-binding cassette domain-containing protein [Candidatus Brockarchaeota archaeon]|nr:ATP-binding cassette domain-containing protein [Candidatus Brockarchaeota archaeon]
MKSVMEATDLTKRYGSIMAVDHISFRVEHGEFFGFLGPNGAGKTTTIRMLTGVIKPDFGTAHIMGYDIRKESLRAKQVLGILPEMANAYVDLTAWQNLMFQSELYGVSKKAREKRAVELLRKLGLYDRKDQAVKGFSKGMKQRLLLCMALVNDPRILVLDEPTTGLDVQSARLIREMLQHLARTGVTIFLTTHNMEEASQLCDRVAIINNGRIAAVDRPEKLRAATKELESIEIAFDRPIEIGSLSGLSNVIDAKKMGDKIRLYTTDPDDLIHQIVGYAKARELKIVALNVLAPSLEDIFIKLTEGK